MVPPILGKTLAATLVLALALPAAAAAAAGQPGQWQGRLFAAWVDPDLDERLVDEGDVIRIEGDSTVGFGLGLEYLFSERVGLELGVVYGDPDIELRATEGGPGPAISVRASDSISFTSISAGINFHLNPGGMADFYFGPMVAYVLYGDPTFRVRFGPITETLEVEVDDDFGWGALAGVDVPLGGGAWSLNATARYLDTSLDATDEDGDEESFDFNPLTLTVGFGYRF